MWGNARAEWAIFSFFRLKRREFEEFVVPLHPKNNKTKEIMPEISKFYGIIIYMYIDDHRSTSGRLLP